MIPGHASLGSTDEHLLKSVKGDIHAAEGRVEYRMEHGRCGIPEPDAICGDHQRRASRSKEGSPEFKGCGNRTPCIIFLSELDHGPRTVYSHDKRVGYESGIARGAGEPGHKLC